MKAINTAIREALEENENELKNDLLSINKIQDIINKNQDFKFDIGIEYNKSCKNNTLLNINYDISCNDHDLFFSFKMPELTYNWNSIDISCEILKYADCYYNNKEYSVNIGSYEGDYYTDLKGFMENIYCNDEESHQFDLHLWVIDNDLEKTLIPDTTPIEDYEEPEDEEDEEI